MVGLSSTMKVRTVLMAACGHPCGRRSEASASARWTAGWTLLATRLQSAPATRRRH